ncbi:cytochrome c oxidase subunit 1 [Globomyces sp. JEL0801]|nr:cytochrome c oxidase subunit 1 [Globomyces sp. JEL0801]
MITTGSYLDKSPPVAGSVRMSAKFNESVAGNIPSYCSPGQFNPDGCLFMTPEQIAFPFSGELNTIFITTRITTTTTPPVPAGCDNLIPDSVRCRPLSYNDPALPKKSYYVANVEYLTIQVDHSVRVQSATSFGSSSFTVYSAGEMVGTLVDACNGFPDKVTEEFNEAYRKSNIYNSTADVITMGKFLQTSSCPPTNSFSLDDVANEGNKEPFRSAGMVISVQKSEFKIIDVHHNTDGSITYLNRHGIRFVFEQTGTIGILDPLACIINIVAAMTLFKFAQIIVDSLMLYLLPQKDIYTEAKYQKTDDIANSTHFIEKREVTEAFLNE